ncbi:hypothetical protein SRHO_G00338910 [Serrasalmus rhombeus]
MTSTLQTLAFKLAPPPKEVGPEPLDPCHDGAGRRYEVVPSVVCSMCCLFGIIYCFFVMISRQQRRVQLMRIRQKEERRESSRKKRRKQQSQHSHHTHAAKAMHPEPAYRRKPNPVRRYDGDVLSPSYIQSFRDRAGGRQGRGLPWGEAPAGGLSQENLLLGLVSKRLQGKEPYYCRPTGPLWDLRWLVVMED